MAVAANVKRLVNQHAKRHVRLVIKSVKEQQSNRLLIVSVGQCASGVAENRRV